MHLDIIQNDFDTLLQVTESMDLKVVQVFITTNK